ncbi:MAG: hypothetical protein WCY88_00620 [Spongiibacteraceae bacterium]
MKMLNRSIMRYTLPASIMLASFIPLFFPTYVAADDTEVYLDVLTLPPEQTRPNVVFILDTSGSMGLSMVEGTRFQEHNHYDPNTVWPAQANYSGGAGDPDYIYLYNRRTSWYANPYMYVNKVHISQTNCTTSPPNSNSNNHDRFLFDDGSSSWADMCDESSSSCNFTPSSTGFPKVDCYSKQDYHKKDSDYPGSSQTNSLFAFDANTHNFLQNYYRYSTLQYVMRDIIDTNYDVNLAMLKFNGSAGGQLIKEALLATDPSNQIAMKKAIDLLEPKDSTPLVESLWEAARYLRGETETYGENGVDEAFIGNKTDNNGGTYDTPIKYACQKSHIILLTDGLPTGDNGRDTAITNLTGKNCSHTENAETTNKSCLDDFADWLYTDTSNDSDRRDHSSLTGDQTIAVHTIGFGLNNNLLIEAGGGTYANNGRNHTADNAEDLAKAFKRSLEAIDYQSDTSVAPAVAVNSYSGLQHRDELYFALFKPAATTRWAGNIKKYKLVNGEIVDATDAGAVNDSTGYFEENSRSFWTTARDTNGDGNNDFTRDGDNIIIGGFATNLTTPTSRKMLTYTGDAPVHNGVVAPTAVNLTENLNITNTAITTDPTLLGSGVDAAEAANIITWARGGLTDYNPTGQTAPLEQPNFFVADGIHNPPVVVTYTTDEACAADDATIDISSCFDDTVFAATNMGTFHAINTSNGSEIFSFVPKELLPNLTTYYQNSGGFTDKIYGLDGPMTVWRHDDNDDGDITTGGNDYVRIYQPMRRGGSNIYAFDFTSRSQPKLIWQINGTGLDETPSGDYRDLAQTWSALQRAVVNWCNGGSCTERKVLFFGGGYDPVHDDALAPVANSTGNAIYMVDAETSELLWSAGTSGHDFNSTDMANSIAADVTVADINGDGLSDFLFAVDIQGKLWRFDFSPSHTSAADFATGGVIAELGGSGRDFRRFYNAPDVAYFAQRGKPPMLTISVPSGNRADPRSRDTKVDDRLYVIFDYHVQQAPDDYTYIGGATISTSDLFEVGETPTASQTHGWWLPLTGTDEKGLARTVTFNGQILMSTFLPASTNTCNGSTGEGRYYFLDALTGESRLYEDMNATPTPDDASDDTQLPYGTLMHGGIPPEPAIIFGKSPKCVENCKGTEDQKVYEDQADLTGCIGTECINENIDLPIHKTYWREN